MMTLEPTESATETPTQTRSRALFPSAPRRLNGRLYLPILIGLTLLASAFVLRHPIATNDGPVHVAFSHVILTYHQADHPLQQQVYTLNLKPNPNLAVYFLMAALMRFLSPALAESIIQILCIAGPVAAGYFAFRTINTQSAWLAIFILPMTLNQMFFLGLYNHAISMGAFLLVIGLYFWMLKAPGWGRAAAVSAALILTFFCHASGYIIAYTGIAVMAFVSASLSLRRLVQATPSFRTALVSVLKRHAYTIAALIPPVPVAFFFVTSSGTKNPIEYGVPLFYRLNQFLKLHTLAANYPYRDRFPAFAISILLLIGFLVIAARVLRWHPEWSSQRRDQAIGAIAATFFAVVVMCIFPDIMGGGWTHYRRFQVYPFFWLLLTLAFENFSARLATLYFVLGATAGSILLVSTQQRQTIIRDQMAPLAQVDQLVGQHCTVLPLVLESHLVDPQKIPDWMDYQPYFQSASRLELTGDRVVLFNYLARLTPYPVHFRPEMEPQANLFHWKPQQIENEVQKVDLQGFEKGSGLKVDYILLWGTPPRRTPAMQREIKNALTQYQLVYHSTDDWVTLYRRQSGLNSVCTANTLTSNFTTSR